MVLKEATLGHGSEKYGAKHRDMRRDMCALMARIHTCAGIGVMRVEEIVGTPQSNDANSLIAQAELQEAKIKSVQDALRDFIKAMSKEGNSLEDTYVKVEGSHHNRNLASRIGRPHQFQTACDGLQHLGSELVKVWGSLMVILSLVSSERLSRELESFPAQGRVKPVDVAYKCIASEHAGL
ncbi:hypothetical protein TorRG33x02_000240 [Trema orientale]|uniref:Uncharacterized protein n=1 Tax=Trema orientale TaxID=63057 RepID=A0A2P5G0Z3_TREOI|nr:hypothetical protein TorRG33x02_000240 [Trema orientale]